MDAARLKGKNLLLALGWALSLAALCVPLATAALPASAGVGWTRTLPGTGAWFLAAMALGLGYRELGRQPFAMTHARLWVLASVLAGIATLGESFAQTGSAALLQSQIPLALLYFAGRVPAYYLGMSLLLTALTVRPASPPAARSPVALEAARPPRQPPQSGADGQGSRVTRANAAEHATDRDRQNGGVTGQGPARPSSRATQPHPDAGGTTSARPLTRPRNLPLSAVQPATVARDPRGVYRAPQANPRALAALGDTEPVAAGDPVQVPHARALANRRSAPPAADRVPVAAWPPSAAEAAWAGRPTPQAVSASAMGVPAQAEPSRAAWPTWAYSLLLLLCWLPYLLAVWPGTVSNDSITQLTEIFGVKPLSNGNPVFQTGLLYAAVWVGQTWLGSADAAVALYVCVQALLMAWLLGYTLARLAGARLPAWLVPLAAAFFALNPVFPVFAFCVGKDTNFAMAVLWFTLMAWRVLESKWPPFRTTAGLCLSAVLCALLRNAGAGVALITLLALLLNTLRGEQRQWRASLVAILLVGGALFAQNTGVLPALNALPMPATENWSVPLQQVARTVAGETLTAQEREAIDATLPADALQAAYVGELSDPVKALWRETATPEQTAAFFGTWLRLGLKHPATYLSATFHNSYGYLLAGYVSTLKPTFLLGMEGRATALEAAFPFTVNPRAAAWKQALQTLFGVAPFRLLVAPGAYGWLTLMAVAGALGCLRRRALVCMLPALVTLVGCMFSAVNGYFRYAMPLYFLAPVLLALLAQALRSGLRATEARARRVRGSAGA